MSRAEWFKKNDFFDLSLLDFGPSTVNLSYYKVFFNKFFLIQSN